MSTACSHPADDYSIIYSNCLKSPPLYHFRGCLSWSVYVGGHYKKVHCNIGHSIHCVYTRSVLFTYSCVPRKVSYAKFVKMMMSFIPLMSIKHIRYLDLQHTILIHARCLQPLIGTSICMSIKIQVQKFNPTRKLPYSVTTCIGLTNIFHYELCTLTPDLSLSSHSVSCVTPCTTTSVNPPKETVQSVSVWERDEQTPWTLKRTLSSQATRSHSHRQTVQIV